MPAYYNEIDPFAAEWLRNLVGAGHIAPGDVDERDIREVAADDVAGYAQCHWFAGIGGWSHALRLAGWSDDRPVWTGSCPCQPLSSAGQRKGHADERHLWPAFYCLIAELRPATVFGEQVASKDGREWLAGVRADLEHLGYACGAADLPAASVGTPHIRQRLWRVAHTNRERRQQVARGASRDEGTHGRWAQGDHVAAGDGKDGGLAHADGGNPRAEGIQRSREQRQQPQDGSVGGGLADAQGGKAGPSDDLCPGKSHSWVGRVLGDADGPRHAFGVRFYGVDGTPSEPARGQAVVEASPWGECDLIPCIDGKARRVEPGIQPLAHGVPARVGRLGAYGNAIVPQVAAAFIEASGVM